MKKIKVLSVALFLFFVATNAYAQKCDTTQINGSIQFYFCPQIAANAFKVVHKKIHEAIFVSLNNNPLKYCDNCKLKDWSRYGIDNHWQQNQQEIAEADYTPFPYEEPTKAPCGEEREPALFLGGLTFSFTYVFENVPSINFHGNRELMNWGNGQRDSLNKSFIAKGMSENDFMFRDKRWNTENAKIADIEAHTIVEGSFSISFQFNKINGFDFLRLRDDMAAVLKKSPTTIQNFSGQYTAQNELEDVSLLGKYIREDAEGTFIDKSQKWSIDNPVNKQYNTRILLGKLIPVGTDDKIRKANDYSVYNMYITITSFLGFDKNQEIINRIDWNKLYSFIKH